MYIVEPKTLDRDKADSSVVTAIHDYNVPCD